MRIIGLFAGIIMVLVSIPSMSYAKITIPACGVSTGQVTVVMVLPKGKWLGFSGRTSSGRIIDYPPVKIGSTSISEIFVLGSRGRQISEVRASTWKNYNRKTNLMERRIEDTGWVRCN